MEFFKKVCTLLQIYPGIDITRIVVIGYFWGDKKVSTEGFDNF